MKIAITGAGGLLGYHLRSFYKVKKDDVAVAIFREDFENIEKLSEKLSGCDAVLHLAGVNRGEDQFVYSQNIEITQKLIKALELSGSKAHVVFSSSTHIERQTLYGKAKRECAEMLRQWKSRSGGLFTEMVLPHIFGEFGKPFYNSAVSTFCHQLANAEEPKIIQDAQLELVHCRQVAIAMDECLRAGSGVKETLRIAGVSIWVTEVLKKLQHFNGLYQSSIIPKLESEFDVYLFNTYRSYLFPKKYPVQLVLRTDNRGSLFEAIKTHHGGQGFLSTTKPGITRGNHFHFHNIERFCVVSGQARIQLRKLFTEEVFDFDVSGDKPCYIDMPTYYTHNITNTGNSELITMFWSHKIFDPENPDTYAETV